MKLTQKLFLSIGLSAMAVLLLAGCQSQSSAQKRSEPIKITYWHRLSGSWAKDQQKIITDFNKSQKKYQVVATSMNDYDTLQQKIMAAGKSGTLPVFAQTPYTNIGDYAKNDLIMPIDGLFSGDNALSKQQAANIVPSFLDTGKFNGKQYALPFSISTRILFYNQQMLADNQLSVPKTWSDVVSLGDKLRAKNVYGLMYDTSYDMELEGMAESAGEKMITSDLQVNIDTPKTKAALTTILKMIKDKTARTALGDQYFSTPFVSSKTAMGIGSSSTIPQIMADAPKGFKWGTAPVPAFDGQSANALAGSDLVMFKGSSKAEQAGALAFMKFALKDKYVVDWSIASGYEPITTSALNSERYQAYLKAHPQYQAAADAIKTSFASTVFTGYSDYRNQLMATVDDTISKHESADTALTALAKKTKQIIKDNQ
ncbi:ABC transporter substrate-binding protein [Lapidilactobacillus mulanensis]|uniref:ABC transporter substrate-binding protein n=1 Tax=Lapidilactobacillus mulanensis TaxID=2485999 RepID=A0ABW4DLP9_9LACO|nr:ABC transporter substrate-binding protein [Lapidilactobacillus mulanensis]